MTWPHSTTNQLVSNWTLFKNQSANQWLDFSLEPTTRVTAVTYIAVSCPAQLCCPAVVSTVSAMNDNSDNLCSLIQTECPTMVPYRKPVTWVSLVDLQGFLPRSNMLLQSTMSLATSLAPPCCHYCHCCCRFPWAEVRWGVTSMKTEESSRCVERPTG